MFIFYHLFSSSSEISLLNDRIRVDRRRIEDSFFEYAILRAASWYPETFDLDKLPLHSEAKNTLSYFTTIYHGAFMAKYASMYSRTSE